MPAPRLDLSALPRTGVQDADTEATLELYFTRPGTAPGEEEDPELDDALAALIDAATDTVDLCLYELKRDTIIDAALRAWERGVDVRMVGDGDEMSDSGYVALDAAGIPIAPRPAGDRIMHNKFVVVDRQAVWTGSTNATETGILQNNNNAVIIESEVMALEYTREFEQMHDTARFGRRKRDHTEARSFAFGAQDIVFHFSPAHDPIQAMVDLVDSAEHTVHFMVFAYTHPDLLAAMVAAQERGVEVVGVFDESQARGAWSIDEELALEGISTYIDGNHNARGFAGGKLHHKVLIVDAGVELADPVVAMGSFNWSRSATLYNDENLVELRNPALVQMYTEEFCRVLAVATVHPDFAGEPVDPCAWTPPVIINEFLPDPVGTDRGQEFVEIVNTGDETVDLRGWALGDHRSGARHVFGDTVLGPGEGVVVFDRGEHGEVPNALTSSTTFLSLNNGGDAVVLRNDEGDEVDRVVYADATPGVSWNRGTDLDPSARFVLHTEVEDAVGTSSPGTRADGLGFDHVEVPDFQVVLNELLPNPVGTDRGSEYVEMVNLGPDEAVLDGFSLHDALGERHVFAGVVLEPGEALVLFDQGEHAEVAGAMESSTGSLSLNNAGDVLTLRSDRDEVHDAVSWSSSLEGVAWNRADDGALDPTLALHDEVASDGAPRSPGTRADGSAW